ncbi:S-layer homology domain-containing protein [Dermabacter hominis]|uniref:S-layer homology domain-containing protein n=1 Tax=Dermabacter hominis TaxID=36740 RepID=UPI0021A598BD|nr:S-layer homology domain-containing protein [Dermabacter hominis]MCT2056768.1 S-layer homology domain-containing protein [Dermabacter hominis]MCT2084474.1 S-layer homology domain-containing protein [Dermabacter hominis]MCT2092195.1 S-layer homology domain-containing protein [Dermabacter hominis]MCT2191059.1 S-layer homology domain-containing protein [Dermabacter hominis]MCT2228001.1 S-layer homology domain-containing protein [Dermabacter hominis]
MSFKESPVNRRTLLKVGAVTPFAAAGVGALGMGLALADGSPAPSDGDTAVVERDLKHTDTVHTHGATDKNPELDGTPAKHVTGYITMAAASWPSDVDSPDVVEFQGKDLNTGEWGDWLSAELMTDIDENASEAVWVGPSSAVNVRAFRDGIDISEQLTAHLITTSESRSDVRLASSGGGTGVTRILPATVTPGTGAPTFITREEWNADTVDTSRLSYAKELKAICIHHTGGSNTYTAAQSPQVVRGMFTYHTKTLGWADLGYNVVVDKYGQIFEGRAGGLHRNVAGAHARGFNTGSCGISVMGDYMDIPVPTAALNAIATVAAWKLASTFTQDVYGTETWTVTTSNVKRNGTFSMPHLFAHRDVNYTDCPGDTYYGQLPELRSLVQQKLNGFKERYPEHLVAYVNGGGRGAFGTVTHVRRAEGAYDVTRLTGGLILTAGGRTSAHKSAFGADWTPAWGRPLESTTGTTQRFENGTATKVNGKVSFTPGGTRTKHFVDVPDNLIFAHEINTLADLGVIRGWPDRTFRPQISVWRDAVIAYMYRIAKEPSYTAPRTSPFLDVDRSQPFYKEICWAHSTGLTTGWKVRGGWEFRPYQPILRDAMAAFLFRASGESLSGVKFGGFKDVNSSLVFEKEIKWMGSTGISRGWDDGTYRPFNQTTRAELAAFLYRYMEHRGLL